MFTLLIALTISLSAACTNNTDLVPEQGMKEKLETLSGTYMDEAPYAYGEAFGQRIFTFDEGKWTLRFTLYLDPTKELPVFEFRTYGTYQVLESSKVVSEAYNALFLEEKKFLTLKTENAELIQGFGFSPCGLELGVEKDVSETGCSAWAAVSECNEDHDLLSLDAEGMLFFGERPADNNMCTADRRPSKLTPPVKKVE